MYKTLLTGGLILLAGTAMADTVSPLRTKFNAGLTQRQEVLFEDFSNVPDGETEYIDPWGYRYADMIASRYEEPGRYIDNSYTPTTGTWEGDCVYAGKNGTVVLQPGNAMMGGYLNTPLGDYSGDLTVTVRCRYATAFYPTDENDSGYGSTDGSDFTFGVRIGGYDKGGIPVTDIDYNATIFARQIYQNDGWVECEFTFRNESANRDGFLQFMTASAIEIDWIRVMDEATYLSAPVVDGASNFTNDGFTINWQPVRRSFDYFIDLWKAVYTEQQGVNDLYDFENGVVPDCFASSDGTLVEGIGKDGTDGFRINASGADNAVTTQTYDTPLTTADLNFMFELNNMDPDEEFWYGSLVIEGLTDNGWETLMDTMCDGYWTPGWYYFDWKGEGPAFEGRYYALRFYTKNMADDNYVALDNIHLWTPRPFTLERIYDPERGYIQNPDNDDDPYNLYTYTDHRAPCSYTVTGLDPDGEYYYRIRSHNVYDFAGTERHHALGVAAPALQSPTDITGTSFTARWTDAPKAQSYIVTKYLTESCETATPELAIFEEGFSNCEGGKTLAEMNPLNNKAESRLDEFTDMPGWTGMNNYTGEYLLGCADYTGLLLSPELPVNPNRGSYKIYVEGYGNYGDMLKLECTLSGHFITLPFEEDGHVSALLEIESALFGDRIKFSSTSFGPFALAQFNVSQDVEAGDILRIYQEQYTVPAGIEKLTLDNLDADRKYGYKVTAKYDWEKETAYSSSTDIMVVDKVTGDSFIQTKVEGINEELTETGRYNAAGISVGNDYKGIVFIRMSDGSVRKTIQ